MAKWYLFSGIHLWRFFNTPAWYSLVQNCDVLGSILSTCICKTQDSLQGKKGESENLSLVETLFVKEGLSPEDVLTVLLDMVLTGVNAVSHSVAFLMYNFSQNPRIQQKLYDEIKQLRVTNMNDVSNIKYLKACIQESFRLNPPMPILSRVLSKDISLDNYLIPKGTNILVATHMCSRREEHFDDAHLFRPGRWLEDNLLDSEYKTTTMPFGYVANSCLAVNLVEMQIATLFVKLIQKFQIEYQYGEIRSKHQIMSEPNRFLKFRFVERN